MNLKILFLVAITLFLSACATLPASNQANNTQESWGQRQAQLQKIKAWTITGAVSITAAADSVSMRFVWEQKPNSYTINFFAPLGTASAKLSGSANAIVLHTSENKTFRANSAEQLMQQLWGLSLPVTPLYTWIRGMPISSGGLNKTMDGFNHIKTLRQLGWVINYLRYTGVGSYDLPSKIFLNKKDLNVRIVIKSWKIG